MALRTFAANGSAIPLGLPRPSRLKSCVFLTQGSVSVFHELPLNRSRQQLAVYPAMRPNPPAVSQPGWPAGAHPPGAAQGDICHYLPSMNIKSARLNTRRQ